ncbi:hypothetical protein [Chryseobacterium oryzae]|uniref:Uncharacterized protein n=1 Tax=Chryseobacterium oryzae TaxID=2929799 RepID=A0ABY4BJM6_9FLAO|nr:hypothetical protein [Chryseobacterium oryzae]UOE39380.1 hypothetical protein MTP08_06290 [Chryseobacterium oryzae]
MKKNISLLFLTVNFAGNTSAIDKTAKPQSLFVKKILNCKIDSIDLLKKFSCSFFITTVVRNANTKFTNNYTLNNGL